MGVENYSAKKGEKSYKIRKERTSTPALKIIVRRLPPSFTKEEFIEAVAPLPDHNYFSFVPGGKDLGPHSFSRVYINLTDVEEVFTFRDKFDGYVFVDQKGNEFPAIVEYAPFSKVPKLNSQSKKDARCGTILEDADYITFLDSLENPEPVNIPLMETLLEEIELREKELKANNGILKIKTPLLEYVEQRGLDRIRGIDRKRRKELDRRRAREEERKRRKEAREFRKRDEFSTKDERETRVRRNDDERLKRNEEKSKFSNAKERDSTQKGRYENFFSPDRTDNVSKIHSLDEKSYSSMKPQKENGKEPLKEGLRSKRYSVGRKRDEKERKKYDPLLKEEIEPMESNSDKDIVILKSPVKKNEKEAISMKDTNQSKGDSDTSLPSCPKVTSAYKKDAKIDSSLEVDDEKGDLKNEKSDSGEREFGASALADDVSAKSEDFEDSIAESAAARRERRAIQKIRNKDRPAMQLYRPGQSRLSASASARQKSSIGDNQSSSSSSSPTMDEDVTDDTDKQN